MKVEVESSSSTERTVRINLDWEEVSDTYQKTVNELRKGLKLNGFRPGKVPASIAKRVLVDQIEFKFSNDVIENTYKDVLEEEGITDFVDLTVKEFDFSEGDPFNYIISVDVDPEIKLFDYEKGFVVPKVNYIIDEEDVDLRLEEIREQNAEVREIVNGAREGDFIICDIQEIDRVGVPIIGRRVESRVIKVGEGAFGEMPQMGSHEETSGLLGAKAEGKVKITLKSKKDQESHYEIFVKRVESHTLPELTDDFVKENLDGVADYKDLREQISKSLQREWNYRSEKEFIRAITDYFINKVDISVPPKRLKRFLDGVVEDIKSQNKGEINEEEIRKRYHSSAVWEIKWYLIQRELIKREKIEVDDQGLEDRIKKICSAYPERERRKLIQYYKKEKNRKSLESDLYEERLYNHLKKFVKTKNETVYTNDLRKRNIL